MLPTPGVIFPFRAHGQRGYQADWLVVGHKIPVSRSLPLPSHHRAIKHEGHLCSDVSFESRQCSAKSHHFSKLSFLETLSTPVRERHSSLKHHGHSQCHACICVSVAQFSVYVDFKVCVCGALSNGKPCKRLALRFRARWSQRKR